MTTIRIAVPTFDLAVALWAAAAERPAGGVYPAAVAEMVRTAPAPEWGPTTPPAWETMLAAGHAAAYAQDADGGRCQRPDPLTLRYGAGESQVRIEARRLGANDWGQREDAVIGWQVVIEGPATSSLHERLGGVAVMAEHLRLTIGHGGVEVTRDGGEVAASGWHVDRMIGDLAAEYGAAWEARTASQAAELDAAQAWAATEQARIDAENAGFGSAAFADEVEA